MPALSKYPEEFKRQAASLVVDGGRSVRDVARELDVNHETLRNWVAAMRKERATPGGPITPDERAELNRQVRRRHGKTDVVDAIAAARAVQSGEATATPKSHDGPVEALRALKMVQRSARKARTQALNQLHALVLTAPEDLRGKLRGTRNRDLITTCAAFRVRADDDSVSAILRLSMRELAQRILLLEEQNRTLRDRMRRITTRLAPDLVAKTGIGPDTATTLLITAGDNPDRLDHEKSFAALVGASPIPVNSGHIQGRVRLNRGGDRDANSALWRIAIVRMATDPDTRDYIARRQAEGKTKSEAIRCLKRYIAREVFNALPRQAID